MSKSFKLISKDGNSFLLNGKVYLGKYALPLSIREQLYASSGTELKYAYGHVIECPGKPNHMFGFNREQFESYFGVVNDNCIPSTFSAEEYDGISETIQVFNIEENRWSDIMSSAVALLDNISEYHDLENINKRGITAVANAVQTKKSKVNVIYSGLNQNSLIKIIYRTIYERFYIENISQLKKKDLSTLLGFLEDLSIYSFAYRVKKI